MPHPPDAADDSGQGPVQGPPSPTDVQDFGDIAQAILDEEAKRAEATVGPTTSTSTSTSSSTGSTISKQTSVTEQISRRFFDVPTEEQFLDNFEIAYGGFLEKMRDQGLGGQFITLALDPATGLMDRLMSEYMGDLALRAERGESIFELVGTEEDFELIRTEPGSESITKGTSESISKSQTKGVSGGKTVRDEDAEVTSKTSGASASTSEQVSKGTSESKFNEIVEVIARPEISAVFKFSPGDFLADRFHGDEGELATFIESEKGVRQRQRQTLAGGTVVAGRQS